MDRLECGSTSVMERPELTARGDRRFRCRECGKQFNERSGGAPTRTCLPSDIIAFVVCCRLRDRLTLRDLSEILLLRGFEVSMRLFATGQQSSYPSWAMNSASGGVACAVGPAQVGMWMRRI
jgi:hypothetical protein